MTAKGASEQRAWQRVKELEAEVFALKVPMADALVWRKAYQEADREVERLREALRGLGDRGECPRPEGNVCEHGIQWDFDCCWRCLKARIAKALLALYPAKPEEEP